MGVTIDMIMIDSGTTCLELVKFLLPIKNLKVVTNGIFITNELCKLAKDKRDMHFSICGGEVNIEHGIISGPIAINFFRQLNINKAFIGAAAISISKGISTSNPHIFDLIHIIRSISKEMILLVDSSKFESYSLINIIPIEKIDEIITDKNLCYDLVEKIKEKTRITLV